MGTQSSARTDHGHCAILVHGPEKPVERERQEHDDNLADQVANRAGPEQPL